ncbi:MAG: hypothetical protein IV092_08440 [Burkholderiaceae bacterium]|nr:hypothetical protein [Burkholderiaceae bacterium]
MGANPLSEAMAARTHVELRLANLHSFLNSSSSAINGCPIVSILNPASPVALTRSNLGAKAGNAPRLQPGSVMRQLESGFSLKACLLASIESAP